MSVWRKGSICRRLFIRIPSYDGVVVPQQVVDPEGVLPVIHLAQELFQLLSEFVVEVQQAALRDTSRRDQGFEKTHKLSYLLPVFILHKPAPLTLLMCQLLYSNRPLPFKFERGALHRPPVRKRAERRRRSRAYPDPSAVLRRRFP